MEAVDRLLLLLLEAAAADQPIKAATWCEFRATARNDDKPSGRKRERNERTPSRLIKILLLPP
jgi:hypothetical protein